MKTMGGLNKTIASFVITSLQYELIINWRGFKITILKFRAWDEEGEVMYYDVYPFKDDTLLLSYDEGSFDEVPASDFILI